MKRMITLITALLVFLVIAFGYEQHQVSQKAEIPTVGILQLMSHPALDTIHHGIIAGLKKSGYRVGDNIKIDFQNAQNDQSNLKTMSTKFANENVAAAIGIATPSAQALANTIEQQPVILGAITDPKGAGLVANNQHPGKNITGVSDQAPLKEQLTLIKQLVPQLKSIGIIYTSSDDSATAQYHKFAALCKQEKINLKAYTIANTNDLTQVAQQAARSVDAIYVPTDNTIASAMNTLVAAANQQRIPVFPAVDTMVKDGGVATYSVDQYQLGIEIGQMTARILQGKNKPATTPIKFIRHGKLIINQQQANKLNLKIPNKLIQLAQQKGELIK